VDMGRAAVHGALCGASTPKPDCVVGGEATEKACGVPVARLQGHSWAPIPPTGVMVNVGTVLGSPSPPSGQGGGGQARCRL